MRDFLEWLWDRPSSYLFGELRTISPLVGARQRFFPLPHDLPGLMEAATESDRFGHDVYVGVLPRIRRAGTNADTSAYTNVLWADVDGKSHGGDKQRAFDDILDFAVPPSVIVDSGHGYHVYWKLDEIERFDDVQPIMKGIARRIGGDPVYDQARILRLPGLGNHKDGLYEPVRLIRFDTTLRYPLSDLSGFAYEPKVGFGSDTFRIGFTPVTPHFLPLMDFDFDPGKGQRSEHDFGVICQLIEHGWNDNEISAVFHENPNGIGAKTYKSGDRYLERTLAKAHDHVMAPHG